MIHKVYYPDHYSVLCLSIICVLYNNIDFVWNLSFVLDNGISKFVWATNFNSIPQQTLISAHKHFPFLLAILDESIINITDSAFIINNSNGIISGEDCPYRACLHWEFLRSEFR